MLQRFLLEFATRDFKDRYDDFLLGWVGAWPTFWLTPVQNATTTDVYSGVERVRGARYIRRRWKTSAGFFGTIHDWRQDPPNSGKAKDIANTGKTNKFPLPQETDFSQYHTYGMLWEPEKITWLFDGKPLYDVQLYAQR